MKIRRGRHQYLRKCETVYELYRVITGVRISKLINPCILRGPMYSNEFL